MIQLYKFYNRIEEMTLLSKFYNRVKRRFCYPSSITEPMCGLESVILIKGVRIWNAADRRDRIREMGYYANTNDSL